MYIITIDINGNVPQHQIDRLVRIHETPQDPVLIEYSDLDIPDGLVITKFDGLVEHYVKGQKKLNPKYLDQNEGVKKELKKQKDKLKKEKFVNK
jgi:hypothetical protein